MAVFTKFEGADGQHVLSTVRHLQRIRIKREGGLSMQAPEDDDDGIITNIKEENTKKSPTAAGQASGGAVVKPKRLEQNRKVLVLLYRKKILGKMMVLDVCNMLHFVFRYRRLLDVPTKP